MSVPASIVERTGGGMSDAGSVEEPEEPRAWVFIRSGALPERWRGRAESVHFVPLTPGEAGDLLRDGFARPLLDPADEDLARLVARGISIRRMAEELGLHPRTVERRVAALRERLGVRSAAELRQVLSRGGF